MPYSVVFFGTQEFATTVLGGLLANPLFKIVAVITQPDRPVGRKKIMTAPPVKILANAKNIPVLQPETLKDFIFPNIPVPDFGIVAQYGNIIPQRILDWPTSGLINTHTSLLPKYRGASPVQAALLNGDSVTGLTIMQMDKGLDTGPILIQEKIAIAPDDKYPEVEKHLAEIAVPNLVKAMQGLVNGSIKPIVQDNSLTSTCGKLDRDSGRADWSKSGTTIYNTFRALYPWPGMWTTWENNRLKLLDLKPTEKNLAPGQVLIENNCLFIGTSSEAIEVLHLQLEGKSAVSAKDFIAGYQRTNQALLI